MVMALIALIALIALLSAAVVPSVVITAPRPKHYASRKGSAQSRDDE